MDKTPKERIVFDEGVYYGGEGSEISIEDIEDLGAQRNTSYMMEQVYTIIDGRYKSGKPMVITTNLDPRRINDASGDEAWKRVFDRILERCYPIEFNGSNRRAAKKMEMREAMRKRLGL